MSLYEQLQAERRVQRWVDHFADPDPIPVVVCLRPDVPRRFIPPPPRFSPVDTLVPVTIEPAVMDRGS